MRSNGTRSPDAIIADIEHIRSEMDSTLLAIEERLTPGQVIDQSLDYLRNSGGREFLSNLGSSVKTNPVPATLVGIGIAWLMVTSQRDARSGPMARSAMTNRVSDAAEAGGERVADALSSARDRAVGTAQRARDAWAKTGDTARDQVDRIRSGYRQLMQEQPLALGAIGIGIGALLAATAPRTRREDEVMGRAADRVKQRVVEAGHEQIERAGEVVRSASNSARTGSSSDPLSPMTKSSAPSTPSSASTSAAESPMSSATADAPGGTTRLGE